MGFLRRLFGAPGGAASGRATGLVSPDQRLDRLGRNLSRVDRERVEWARELVGAGESVWQLGAGARWFALAAAIDIDRQGLENVLVLSGGTDGTDGPTDAAGAIADRET
ncbi:MAG: glycerate kinase, partial [Thermoanaerobaculia bacterium]